MAKLSLPPLALLTAKPAASGETFVHRWGPFLATCAVVFAGAWLATSWFWYFYPQSGAGTAPAAAPRAPLAAGMLGEQIAAAQLFGSAPSAAGNVETVSTLNVKLKGVFAYGGKQPSAAIFNTGQKDEFVAAGRDVLPGVRLEQVFATHVVLKRGAALERVNLEERVAGAGGGPGPGARPSFPRPLTPPGSTAPMIQPSVPPPPPPNVPPPAMSAPGLPPGVVPPNMPSPQQFIPGMPPGGVPGIPGVPPGVPTSDAGNRFGLSTAGITLDDVPSGSVLARIGLRSGDVIKSVNGQPISSEADVARLYQLVASGQPVSGEVLRAGKTIPISVTAKP
jgi:general secretion pathway protein C